MNPHGKSILQCAMMELRMLYLEIISTKIIEAEGDHIWTSKND